ncbi:MAG: FAD-dependent oxidoreductase [Planctomycetaceae bacterium]
MRWPAVVCLIASIAGTVQSADPAPAGHFDVVIYGGTSAGLIAAVQTVKLGHTAVVIEPRDFIGGLSTSGLGWTDTGNKAVIGGLSREFYQRIRKKYEVDSAWQHGKAADYRPMRPGDDALWAFEPHVAEEVFQEMLAGQGIKPATGLEIKAVSKAGTRITGVLLSDGRLITGKRFIDATYEGDLLAMAGVSSTVGREANTTYGETLNGVQTARAVSHQFVKPVDPYVTPGDKSSGLLPGISADPGVDGEADHRLQAFNYRLCITDVKENQIPFAQPKNYNPVDFELLLRNFEAGDLRLPLSIIMVPNRKTDVNNNHAVSTDWIGMNYDYPQSNIADRRAFEQRLKDYTQGLLWTMANHDRVPEKIRTEVSRWGWAQDEWTDNDHWPYWLYVREGRRMVSDYVHTELDCRRLRDCPDPVGMGSYNMDSHNCQRYVTTEGHVRNEGDIQVSPRGAYLISYRATVPKRSECTNLLVPVCLSCSHIAYGSIRMEPVFMILAQSAATAAVQSLTGDQDVQDVDYAQLRTKLDADGQVLMLPTGTGAAHMDIDPKSLPGVVVDDTAATKTGDWSESSSTPGYIGTGYLHDSNAGQGTKSVTYELTAPQAGQYQLRLAYTRFNNRATNVPVTIETPTGKQQRTINQREKPSIDGRFTPLGNFNLTAGAKVRITLSNTKADGHVIADAVQMVPVK